MSMARTHRMPPPHSSDDWADFQDRLSQPLFLEVLDRLNVGPGSRLLDVNCGTDLALHLASERGAQVGGFDASEVALVRGRERTPQATLLVADLDSLSFPDASFDVVAGFNSLQFALDPAAALRETVRVTRPVAGRYRLTGTRHCSWGFNRQLSLPWQRG
jgi:ubiquinone/menaquinone biosynthesis C-methylase UbiE